MAADDLPVPGRERPTHYEIVVRGEIGPALREALLPVQAGPAQVQTVLRTHLGQDSDLADLVQALRARGFEVASITVLA
ncbi:hypothetical protein GCM10009844_04830 [Nocardioides koreensis]|uniref:Uncharacterized protein n=1 Tax=Nocardioides koreensis TaxID=433651 RepID=A0ABP5KXV9_9ACTN